MKFQYDTEVVVNIYMIAPNHARLKLEPESNLSPFLNLFLVHFWKNLDSESFQHDTYNVFYIEY